MKGKWTAVLLVVLAICLLTGCDQYPLGNTVICKDLQLTVPGDFMDLSAESYALDADFMYGWNTLVCKGLAEDKSQLQEMSLDGYTALVISGNGRSCTPQPCGDGYMFSYEAAIGDASYTYTIATYEGPSNFWILQFYCPSEDLEKNQPEINMILESIQVHSGG